MRFLTHWSAFRLLIFSVLIGWTSASYGQFITTSGTVIKDPEGEPMIWRGIGLGGWMLQEGYMLKTRGPQHTLEARIEELIGPADRARFYEAWWQNHFTKRDVDSLAAWGYNTIRLPMHYKLFTPPIEQELNPNQSTWLDRGFVMVDSLISWCRAHEIYLILDLHAAPGGQGENADINDYDRTQPSLWESEANQQKTIDLWVEIARRYQNEPVIAAYDLINEPNWGFEDHTNDLNGCKEQDNAPLWGLLARITKAIRQVDQNHILVIEGNCWGNNYRNLPPLWDDNLVISYHKYWNENKLENIQHMLDMRSQRQVPIWLGESGENSNVWFSECIELLESQEVGWAWWPYKKLGWNNPFQIPMNEDYQQVVDFWNEQGPKPSREAALVGLMQLANDAYAANNEYHPDVVDAMIRAPHTQETRPYREHKLSDTHSTILACADYDMGRVGQAYEDSESVNETGRPGGQPWNLGFQYRNDGVDIGRQEDPDEFSSGYFVGWTESGEWMKYTVEVEQPGTYQLSIRYAGVQSGRIELLLNDQSAFEAQLPATQGEKQWQIHSLGRLNFQQGKQFLILKINQGGLLLDYLKVKPVDP